MPEDGSPLTDSFGRVHRYLRIAVTDRCNLKCAYCLPAGGSRWRPLEEILTLDEICRVAQIMAAMGVEKIRLTGGEPTLRQDLDSLVECLSATPGMKTIGLTTNGVLLRSKAESLRRAGVHAVNISLDTLRRERFARLAGHDLLGGVLAGIDAALQTEFDVVKINTVVIAGINDDELSDFVEFTRTRPVELRFIEFMPFDGNGWSASKVVTCGEMKRRIEKSHSMTAFGPFARVEGYLGTVSFITPLSAPFCGGCNRLRLTADGAIKTCLLHPAEAELRPLLRSGASDEMIAETIRAALMRKQFAHPSHEEMSTGENRCMTAIGG